MTAAQIPMSRSIPPARERRDLKRGFRQFSGVVAKDSVNLPIARSSDAAVQTISWR